jgi:hypothetical protein
MNTNWTAADPNVRGFVCNPQAIGVLAGLPLAPVNIPGATLNEQVIEIPGPDISVCLYSWFSLAQRTAWCSYDLVLGSALLDSTAGILIKSQ